jgi:hydrogenase/urease accessory protein HupE
MEAEGRAARTAAFMHRYFLGFLFAAYTVAAVAPAGGLWMRQAHFRVPGLAGLQTGLSRRRSCSPCCS